MSACIKKTDQHNLLDGNTNAEIPRFCHYDVLQTNSVILEKEQLNNLGNDYITYFLATS